MDTSENWKPPHLVLLIMPCILAKVKFVKITINLQEEEFPEERLSIAEILKKKNYSFPHIITRLNGKLVERGQRDSTYAQDGDDVELYHLISGG
ncbi:MAG: sulfur carrier protein ThiS [Spirochaetia bacterium]|nr:sulfur carrier protein ThiS [Spirochaetia bacterium]